MDNTITIVGNLTQDPTQRYTSNGTGVCSFSVAVNERFTDKAGEQQERTSFVDVSAWGDLGEHVAESLHRGDRAIVTGKIQQDTWEDKETGGKRSKLAIKASSVGAELRFHTAVVSKAGQPAAAGVAAGFVGDDDGAPM